MASLGLLELVKLGGGVLARMALDGELRWRHVWTAFEGAADYARAIAAGDVASDETAQMRASRCAACPASTRDDRWVRDERVWFGWCGERLRPSTGGPDGPDEGPTCGCMVFQKVELTVNVTTGTVDKSVPPEAAAERAWGRATAAGGTMVGSKSCPRKHW